jgi:hypothetical protein
MSHVLTDSLALGVLALSLFVQVASDKGLIHLLICVELVDIIWRWSLTHLREWGNSLLTEVTAHCR